MSTRFKKGFTLIELLVVISIIGILMGIIIPSLSAARATGRDAKRVADIKSIQLSLALYYSDNLRYPCDIYTNSGAATCISAPNFIGLYMPQVPLDPDGVTKYKYAAINPTGLSCATATKYHLGAVLETSGSPHLSDDIDAVYATHCTNSVTGNFAGTSAACSGSAIVNPDKCYDVE